MTAVRNAIAPALALVLTTASWGCSSTSGSNAAVQLPPRQPDAVAGGYSAGLGNGEASGNAGPYGNPPQVRGYGTTPGVYGSGTPRGTNGPRASAFPSQPTNSYPQTPGTRNGKAAQNTGACNAAAARSVIGQLGTIGSKETAKAASGAERVRITFPGQPLAKDFNGARLNLETDNQNRIVNVRCG